MGSEVIEVVERRRRWPAEVRLRILDEVLQPGASVAAVADRHGVARGLIYQWLKQLREGRDAGAVAQGARSGGGVRAGAGDVGGERCADQARSDTITACARPASTAPTSKRRSGAVEIRLANGRVVKVEEGIAPDALARLLAVVDGDRS